MENPRDVMNGFMNGMKEMNKSIPEVSKAMMNLTRVGVEPGKLTHKEKELAALAAAFSLRCKECSTIHIQNALKMGITRQEIMEIAGVAMMFGGGPVMTFTAVNIPPIIDEFEKEVI